MWFRNEKISAERVQVHSYKTGGSKSYLNNNLCDILKTSHTLHCFCAATIGRVGVVVTHLTCMREISHCDTERNNSYHEIFHGLSQSFQAK
jgi:hypothetical protein